MAILLEVGGEEAAKILRSYFSDRPGKAEERKMEKRKKGVEGALNIQRLQGRMLCLPPPEVGDIHGPE